jgi:site-specific recombinase XerD
MSWKAGGPQKFQREIQHHRGLYEGKDLRRVRNNWVFYWRFLAYLEDIGYRPRTIQGYYDRLSRFLRWLGRKPLRRVRQGEIEAYLLYHKRERQRVAYTIRYEKQALGVFFNWLMGFCAIRRNPTAALGLRIYYPQPEKMDLFSRAETELIVSAPLRALQRVDRDDFSTERRWREELHRLKMEHLVLRFLFSTGMRPCELVALEIKDFDRETLRLRVRNKGNQQYIASDRHVFLSEGTKQRLEELLRLSQTVRGADSAGKLFIHYHGGGPLGAGYCKVVVKRWAAACGIARNVYAYMARYTFCTRLVENGVDLYSLKRLMGHKQVAVTLRHYLKLTSEEIRKEWKQFNPLAEGTGS